MVTYVLPIGNVARSRLWIPACGKNDDRRSTSETGSRAIVYPPKRTHPLTGSFNPGQADTRSVYDEEPATTVSEREVPIAETVDELQRCCLTDIVSCKPVRLSHRLNSRATPKQR